MVIYRMRSVFYISLRLSLSLFLSLSLSLTHSLTFPVTLFLRVQGEVRELRVAESGVDVQFHIYFEVLSALDKHILVFSSGGAATRRALMSLLQDIACRAGLRLKSNKALIYIHTHTHTCAHTRMYVCVYVYMFVRVGM